jgi:hypothetical protein
MWHSYKAYDTSIQGTHQPFAGLEGLFLFLFYTNHKNGTAKQDTFNSAAIHKSNPHTHRTVQKTLPPTDITRDSSPLGAVFLQGGGTTTTMLANLPAHALPASQPGSLTTQHAGHIS